ncbi:MAG TPA: MerR family transcriptional regulator [Candidatus Omnitrophota bacterium]|jgi:DNA-binding transcriptional MerR regulator|nr:MerR family transcriptional regulator [Candidatus Omnitrophota bacterium]
MDKRFLIDEVIRELGISRKTLYLWEASGKIPKAKRDPMSNYRFWTEADLKNLKRITGRK